MKEEIKIVTMADEEGTEYELEVIKEFEHNNKKYVALYDETLCDCEDCHCEEDKCECDDKEDSDDKTGDIYIYELQIDEDGKEIFKEIEDDKLMDELISKLEGLLFKKD